MKKVTPGATKSSNALRKGSPVGGYAEEQHKEVLNLKAKVKTLETKIKSIEKKL